mmetsp:Transcript_21560/g.25934  ORF Transcript_21560/g.25934 Transcript_21560/m.25934 type:complete len:289 (-) Transcript_21560:1668-2534(-)
MEIRVDPQLLEEVCKLLVLSHNKLDFQVLVNKQIHNLVNRRHFLGINSNNKIHFQHNLLLVVVLRFLVILEEQEQHQRLHYSVRNNLQVLVLVNNNNNNNKNLSEALEILRVSSLLYLVVTLVLLQIKPNLYLVAVLLRQQQILYHKVVLYLVNNNNNKNLLLVLVVVQILFQVLRHQLLLLLVEALHSLEILRSKLQLIVASLGILLQRNSVVNNHKLEVYSLLGIIIINSNKIQLRALGSPRVVVAFLALLQLLVILHKLEIFLVRVQTLLEEAFLVIQVNKPEVS